MRTDSAVIAATLPTRSGHRIGVLTLNVPAAMNAVDLAMVNRIDKQLARWEKNDRVVAVLMRGAGDKAFCAGGDIRQLHQSMRAEGAEQYRYADDFFRGEYSKNYRVHLFSKPLIAWGNGFVMGGGLGLFIGANHRVGTETLRLAWPEIRIGLFPDVGASWYLSRLPYPVGHWMALSGSHMNAVDCRTLGLIQYALSHNAQVEVLKALKRLPWGSNVAENHHQVRTLLHALEVPSAMPASRLEPVQDELTALLARPDLLHIDQALRGWQGSDEWLRQGIANYRQGCPATAWVIMEQLRRGAQMSLREVAQWELGLAYQAVRHPDFSEGIRAMVIDKDFSPRWQHESVQTVPASWVNQLLASPWTADNHPLRELPGWQR